MNKFFKRCVAALLCVLALCMSLSFVACGNPEEIDPKTYSVYAPDGAPALALANGMAVAATFDYHVVDSSTISSFVTGENPDADFCILPLNLASKLLGTGETYRMLGSVTNGNMYFLTTNGETLTEENLSTLIGKTVGVVQLANVPGLTLQATLQKYELPYTILENDSTAASDKINLKAVDAATGVTPAGGCDYYLCPEPAASTKVAKTGGKLQFAGNLQTLYGENGYPQAVAVVHTRVAPEAVEAFISLLEGSADYLDQTEAQTVVSLLDGCRTEGLTAAFTAENLTPQVIRNCSVRYTAAAACKETVNAFLQQLIAINPNAAKSVSDSFFYTGK